MLATPVGLGIMATQTSRLQSWKCFLHRKIGAWRVPIYVGGAPKQSEQWHTRAALIPHSRPAFSTAQTRQPTFCIAAAAAAHPYRAPTRHLSLSNIFLPRGEDGRPARTTVESYTNTGFLVNGTLLPGAVVLLPEAALLWNVETMEDITWESLVALRVLNPKPGPHTLPPGPRWC
jgi:hypothetical protein